MAKNHNTFLGTSATTHFEEGEELMNEETQELFDNIADLIGTYEHQTGRIILMNLGLVARSRKRGTQATYAHLTEVHYCEECQENHAIACIIPGTDSDPLINNYPDDFDPNSLFTVDDADMNVDPFGNKYIVHRGIRLRKAAEEGKWEQIAPQDDEGREYPEFLQQGAQVEKELAETSVQTKLETEFDEAVKMLDPKALNFVPGSKTLN